MKESKGKESKTAKSKAERILEGQLLVRTIIEMLGAPKDHIEKTMREYVTSLKGNTDFEIIKENIAEAIEQPIKEGVKVPKDTKLYSTYAELEIWFKNPEKLIAFCFDCLPSSIEVIEPEKITLENRHLSTMLNDMQANLHKLDMVFKSHKADTQAAGMVFRTLLNNFIGYCLQNGKSNAKDISTVIGIDEKKVERILDELAQKEVIHKKDNTYSA